MMEAFSKCIFVQANEEEGADWFPYGHQISPKSLLKQLHDLDIDHVAHIGEYGIIHAYGENDEGETVYWSFCIPPWMKTEKWIHAIGWFRPII